jgi:hypothetical protein
MDDVQAAPTLGQQHAQRFQATPAVLLGRGVRCRGRECGEFRESRIMVLDFADGCGSVEVKVVDQAVSV